LETVFFESLRWTRLATRTDSELLPLLRIVESCIEVEDLSTVMASHLVLAMLTGIFAGALFSVIQLPIPAPPNLPGVLGIVGIFLGYRLIEWLGAHIDILEVLATLY
jgi:XapX domain-containing protein